jgi:hypothetical protein
MGETYVIKTKAELRTRIGPVDDKTHPPALNVKD